LLELVLKHLEQYQVMEGIHKYNELFGNAELVDDGKNTRTILCNVCASIILNPRKATLIQKEIALRTSKAMDEFEPLSCFWLLRDMYDFENIGFTKVVDEKNLRYLTCADCERGVLGLQYLDDPTNIYLTTHRIKYKTESAGTGA